MADFYSFFFCKLQPQENNLSIQLICVHAKKVSLISFSTVKPQNFVFQSPTHRGVSEWRACWSSEVGRCSRWTGCPWSRAEEG